MTLRATTFRTASIVAALEGTSTTCLEAAAFPATVRPAPVSTRPIIAALISTTVLAALERTPFGPIVAPCVAASIISTAVSTPIVASLVRTPLPGVPPAPVVAAFKASALGTTVIVTARPPCPIVAGEAACVVRTMSVARAPFIAAIRAVPAIVSALAVETPIVSTLSCAAARRTAFITPRAPRCVLIAARIRTAFASVCSAVVETARGAILAVALEATVPAIVVATAERWTPPLTPLLLRGPSVTLVAIRTTLSALPAASERTVVPAFASIGTPRSPLVR